jgi:hypothetical protein
LGNIETFEMDKYYKLFPDLVEIETFEMDKYYKLFPDLVEKIH